MILYICGFGSGYRSKYGNLLGAIDCPWNVQVDEAIVVAENIYRHLRMGNRVQRGLTDGASEMSRSPYRLTPNLPSLAFLPPANSWVGQMGVITECPRLFIDCTVLLLRLVYMRAFNMSATPGLRSFFPPAWAKHFLTANR